MATKTEVVNYAYGRLGVNRINNINDETEEARRANSAFEIVYQALLSKATWNFAIKEATLPKVTDVSSLFGFDGVFQMPNDVYKVVACSITDFKVQGKQIHGTGNSVNIKYVSDSIDPSGWSPLFVQLVATSLAADVCYAFTQSASLTQVLKDEAEQQYRIAKAQDSSEDYTSEITLPSSFTSARSID